MTILFHYPPLSAHLELHGSHYGPAGLFPGHCVIINGSIDFVRDYFLSMSHIKRSCKINSTSAERNTFCNTIVVTEQSMVPHMASDCASCRWYSQTKLYWYAVWLYSRALQTQYLTLRWHKGSLTPLRWTTVWRSLIIRAVTRFLLGIRTGNFVSYVRLL